jgi:sugar O-acyltransferase (sialic acid O-acetyltransferase NeuD family)
MNKSRQLVIVGASGFGLEVFFLAERLGMTIKGFLDDDGAANGRQVLGVPVLGLVSDWSAFADCAFVVAVGNPRLRQKIVAKMRKSGAPEFATLVDPSAIVAPHHVTLGKGCIICAGAIMTTQISLAEHVIVNLNSTIGHETVIGNFVTIAPLVAVSGKVTLGDLVEVGTNSCIRQGLTMAPGAMLGMGGVLTKDAPENAIMVGNPATLLRTI